MTKTNTPQKVTIITGVTIAMILVGFLVISEKIELAEAGGIITPPPPPSSICPEDGTVQHWDKIIFQITKDQSHQIPEEFLNTSLDLKIIDPPGKVVNLEKEIFDHLTEQLEISDIELSDLEIEVLDVRYETVNCGLMGPEGPQGPQGPQGPEGPLIGKTYNNRVIENLSSDPGETSISVDCDEGDVATGGGMRKSFDTDFRAHHGLPSGSGQTPTGWFAIFENDGSQVEVFVVCLDNTP